MKKPSNKRERFAFVLFSLLFNLIDFGDSIPYNVRFLAWCAYHFTLGEVLLRIRMARYHRWSRRVTRQLQKRKQEYDLCEHAAKSVDLSNRDVTCTYPKEKTSHARPTNRPSNPNR